MFDAICIRRQELAQNKEPIDIVLLAEAMLFYQRVHVIADVDMISYLAWEMGPAFLLELIKDGYLQLSYTRKRSTIVHRSGRSSNVFYEPATIDSTNGEWRLERLAPDLFSKAGSAPGYARQLGRDFAGLVTTIDLDANLINATKADFTDEHYVEHATRRLLQTLVPDYNLPHDYVFHLQPYIYGGRAGFQIDTNIDFKEANARYNQLLGTKGDTISGPTLLLYLFEARCDLHFAAMEEAELATQEATSAIIGTKFSEILTARAKSQQNIEEFQRLVVVNSHEIGESIKFRYRTWGEYLLLLKRARKHRFQEWLGGRDPDVPLINEYMKALTADTWIDKTPVKLLRFVLFQGLGTAMQAFGLPGVANLGLSAVDSFLADRLARGWKPTQFVNESLKRDFTRQD